MRTLFFCTFCLIFSNCSIGQKPPVSASSFFIKGTIVGRDTGSIILWYNDKNNNVQADTTYLNNGHFFFSGTTNKVCEAMLWADPNKREFDNPSMIRFLLEPKHISILAKKDLEAKASIKGLKSQVEKQSWDNQKSTQLNAISRYRATIDSLFRATGPSNRDASFNYLVKTSADKLDSVYKVITQRDVQYIKAHPDSYLSAYLLFRQVRKLSVDSIQWLYSNLSAKAQKSSVGHDVLSYVYPKTDDNDFRKANPLIDAKFDERLRNIKSVHDLSLFDTVGSKVDLSSFRGKYLVISFWSSTCGPCIKNIPTLNQFMQTFSPNDIQFVSVSLDKDASEWKRAITKYHFNGLHVSDLQGFNGLAPVYCKVLWVPRYIIADQSGKIINYDAPHPNDPEFKKSLDNLLKQKQLGEATSKQ